MTTLYKLTDVDGYTRRGIEGETLWSPGKELRASGKGELYGPGFVHAYTDPLLAVLLNPIHASIDNPLLWEAEGDVAKTEHGLKVGCTRLKTLRTIQAPEITTTQRVRFGILAAMEVCNDAAWRKWAKRWLSGEDRTADAAWAAGEADAAQADAAPSAWAEAWVAGTAADAAWEEAWVAGAAAAAAAATAAAMFQVDLPAIASQAVEDAPCVKDN